MTRLTTVVLAAAMLAAAGGSPAAAQGAPAAGAIAGRVAVKAPRPWPGPRPRVADLGMAEAADAPDRTRSVVYLETAPHGAFEETPRARATLDQRNEAFVPYVLAVTAGTTVDFPNDDTTYHNVFSLSETKRFDLGRYPRGQSRSVRFDRPGVVRVFCEIHSHMSAYILVFAHRYFAVTGADGRYRIDGIPPGTYTVVAWNDGRTREQRTVELPAAGGTVELDFTVE